jgi:hypothetical protein
MKNEEVRTVLKTEEFNLYFDSLDLQTRRKYDYAIQIMQTQKVVSEQFVKKIQNTGFFFFFISVSTNEYGTMLVAADNPNFMEATRVVLLNSFLKKDSKQYKREIAKARNILEREELL